MSTQLAKEPKPGLHLVEFDKMFERMQKAYDSIAKRAYELFEQRGRIPGFDFDDWRKAESELFGSVPVEIAETDTEVTIHADVPGFAEKDLSVSVEPRRVLISGKTEAREERKKGKTIYSERRVGEIFRSIGLPIEVDANKVMATLKNGTLEVTLPKVAKKEAARIPVKVA